MKATDKKIVDANAGLTPYQLLTEKGISQAAFDELVKAEDNKVNAVLNAKSLPGEKKQLKPSGILKGALSPQADSLPHMQHSGRTDKVRITPTSGGGSGTEMSRVHAENLKRKNPNKYRIDG